MRNLVTWCNFVFAVNNVNVKFDNLSHILRFLTSRDSRKCEDACTSS